MNYNSIITTTITNIGDPFVMRTKGTYYMYATSFVDGFYCWHSTDLINWSAPRQVYKAGARSFGYTDFWAPEVVEHNGKYIMHYSARSSADQTLYIGVAVSETPMGDFVDVYDCMPMFNFGYAAIDGHVLIDNGKYYFYYDRDCSQNIVDGRNESHIYLAELDSTLTRLITEPVLIMKPEQQWEKATGDFRWNEGPFVVKRDDWYYLMYSSGYFAAPSYSIGYAVSRSPYGPFVKYENNPILYSVDGLMSGPGHNSVITAPCGTDYCVFHTHTDIENPSQNRQVRICPIRFSKGKIFLP